MDSSISVTTDVVIFALRGDDLQVLLVKRKLQPFAHQWTIPGGHVIPHESLEDAAVRVLFEKTSVRDIHMEQLYTFGDVKRDPRGRTITVTYLALVPGPLAVEPGPDTDDTEWKSVYKLPEMGFDHANIVTYALKRLRYKLEYSAVGFRMLPPEFTLTQLQRAYETVLGQKLDKRNFRRRILQAIVIEQVNKRTSGEGRPAMLYRFRDDAVSEVKTRRLFP